MKIISVILLTLFALLFSSCVKDKDQDDEIENYIKAGDQLPDFTVKNAAGEELNSEQLKGHVTLLVFFMTTCPDCERELPKIEGIWQQLHENTDFKLVTVSRAETASDVNKYWSKNEFKMPFYLDPAREVFSLFANSTIPRVYLVNRENIVTWMAIEEMELTTEQLIEKIEELIEAGIS